MIINLKLFNAERIVNNLDLPSINFTIREVDVITFSSKIPYPFINMPMILVSIRKQFLLRSIIFARINISYYVHIGS